MPGSISCLGMAGHKQACGWVLIALQIRLIDSPTERTTAATDALLALFALSSLFYLNYVTSQYFGAMAGVPTAPHRGEQTQKS